MLIRAVTMDDCQTWLNLAHESDEIVSRLIPDIATFYDGFDDYMKAKIRQNEAFMAVDRMSERCLGIVAFSKSHNRVTFLGVSTNSDFYIIGSKLMEVALNQLDNTKEISVTVLKSDSEPIKQERVLYESLGFTEHDGSVLEAGVPACLMKRPPVRINKTGSFHHNYSTYVAWQSEAKCPVCNNNEPRPPDSLMIELEHSWVEASMLMAQGLLWGKYTVISKKHFVELHEMPPQDLVGFMTDVQRVAKVLKEVSGAVKINMELHGNTIPHLHVHLFPRYLDDSFPGQAIDYTKTAPVPYENKKEFDYFVEQMKLKLGVTNRSSDRET
ncbi:MAG TPA: GNAT family N-acetyltransferase [Dehalococcoidia bacterium]|nr:GNAT family N-acetyltransferase [Dehalococcoidia bacterium]